MSTFWSHHWAAPAAPAQPPQPRSAYRPARLIFGANRAYPCPISPKRMRHRLGLDASEWSALAVLATLSFYKNEARSISFRSLPKDGGLVVIKTRPSRGFRSCATVLHGCRIGGSPMVGPTATT